MGLCSPFLRCAMRKQHWLTNLSSRRYLRARFLSLARSKLRLCSANHRPGYWSNLPCDWPNTAWAYSEQETENGPWSTNALCRHCGRQLICRSIFISVTMSSHYTQPPSTPVTPTPILTMVIIILKWNLFPRIKQTKKYWSWHLLINRRQGDYVNQFNDLYLS